MEHLRILDKFICVWSLNYKHNLFDRAHCALGFFPLNLRPALILNGAKSEIQARAMNTPASNIW